MNFVVSHELLLVLKWLLEHEQESLKKIIARSLRNGLYHDINTQLLKREEAQDDIQRSIVDFFFLLETLLYEVLDEDEIQKLMQRSLIPEINKIDSTAYDNSTFALSVAKATNVFENNPKRNPKEILCRELLKRWKPKKLSNN